MLLVIRQEEHIGNGDWSFEELFKAIRLQHNLSMSQLAQIIGLDHSYVSRIESGSRKPSQEVLEHMADRLQLNEMETQRLLISAGYISDILQKAFTNLPEFLQNTLHEAHQLAVSDPDFRDCINEGHKHLNKMHGSFL